MKKIISLALSVLLMMTALAACGNKKSEDDSSSGNSSASVADDTSVDNSSEKETASSNQTLTLYTWAGMFSQELLDDFKEKTGISVTYATFDSDETMLAKLQTEKGGTYDLVIADDYIIELAIDEKLVAPIDKAKLSHYDSINPEYQKQFFDPNDEFTVPLAAGVQTIVYNPDMVEKEITGYEDLWDSSFENNLALTANYRVMNGMALKILGESYNTEDIAVIEKAGEKLNELAPNVRLIKDDDLQNALLSGEVSAGVMYTAQVTKAKMTNPGLKVVFPKEGIGLGIMAQFIPSDAPNPNAAHEFIDYLLTPEIAAKYYEYLGYYSTNKDADELISEEYREFLTLPKEISSEDMEMIELISPEATEAHEKVWTAFKTAAGQS